MIKNLAPMSLLAGGFLTSLLSSCGSGGRQNAEPSPEKTLSFADCIAHGEKFYLFDGLDAGLAESAIEGDAEKSREIVTEILRRGGDGASSDLSACQLIFWSDLSAQNGDLHSAYELATISSLGDGFRCRRTKHWARVVLSRVDEFRHDVLRGADAQLLERSIEGRKKQMEDALQRQCASL